MKIKEIVETIYLRVNGGRPSNDSTIHRADIRFFLPAAINYVLDKAHNMAVNEDRDRDLPSEFYVEGTAPINWSGDKGSFDLIRPVTSLKGNAGIRFVYDENGNYATPIPDYAMYSSDYYIKKTPCMRWFRRTGSKVDVWGFDPDLSTINYQYLVKPEDLGDDDEAPIQAGLEMDVMNILHDWFTGAKQIPYDNINDSRDSVNATNR